MRIDRVARAAAAFRDRRAGGGDYLRLHPTGAISGHYEAEQRAWWGPPQAAISHQFADLEDGYGFLIECPHHTTGLAAAATWESGRTHKEWMLEWARTATFINLTRDRGHGRVAIDASGNAVPQYPLADELDIRNFRRGLVEMIGFTRRRGRRIVAVARKPIYWERGDDLESFIGRVGEASLAPREHGIFSAHQMGTCRMGTDPETSVAGPWGELHDVEGVWIGDASAFPTSSGTNPMITIMALAHRTAGAIAGPEPKPGSSPRWDARGRGCAPRGRAASATARAARRGGGPVPRALRKAGEQLLDLGRAELLGHRAGRDRDHLVAPARAHQVRPITARSSPVGWMRTHSVPAARTRLASFPAAGPSRGGTRGLATHAG